MGYLQAWNWREKFPVAMNNGFLYPAHAGPVYAMAFSNANNKPNANNTSSVPGASGSFLATGGADAVVGLWNVATMTCDRTIGRPQSERTKLIRSLAVSPDNRVLAIATEENAVELVNIPTTSKEQAAHSKANRPSRKPFSLNNPAIDGSSSIGMASFGPRKGLPGAEDIAFHPSATISSGSDSGSYLLACARTDAGPMAGAPVTIMKLTMNL